MVPQVRSHYRQQEDLFTTNYVHTRWRDPPKRHRQGSRGYPLISTYGEEIRRVERSHSFKTGTNGQRKVE